MSPQDLRAAVAAALATLLGACALAPVFSSGGWLPPVLAVVLVVFAGGLLLRAGGPAAWARLRGGRPVPGTVAAAGVVLVPIGQLLLLACLLTTLFAPARAFLAVLPTWSSLADLMQVMSIGAAEMREQATPALPLTGLVALTAVFVGLVAVLADLVAVGGRQAALAGAGLLVLYCVPVTTIRGGFGLLAIAGPAAGFALLLWTDQHRRLPVPRRGVRGSLVAGAVPAARVAGGALAAGLVLGSLVPTLHEGSFATGFGGVGGGSTGTGLDPVAQLHGQLTLPEPIPLLRLDSSADRPGYLRTFTLDLYDADGGWSLNNLDGETSIAEDSRLAPLPSGEPSRRVTATVQTIEHDDRFLPVPTSPLKVEVYDADPGNWRFDYATGTVFGRGTTTGGLTYGVSAAEPRPSPAQLAAAEDLPPGDPVQDRFTALPELHPEVAALVAELTADGGGPYERVRRIQAYLTDRSEGFIYSLATEPGTSGDDLADFLRLRRGYCEQYAGTMAVLVRATGVPARVAFGYTTGTEERGGTRLITSDDAHAWVEAYFDNIGWLPFDPTPISVDRAADLPWAPRTGVEQNPDSAPTAAPAAPTQAGPTTRRDRAEDVVPTAGSSRGAVSVLPSLVGGVGIALLLAGLIAVPFGARALQRRRRLAHGGAGAIWDELTATVQDLGLRLQPSWTPRQTAQELTAVLTHAGTPDGPARDGADAVRRLALAEEAVSYGPARETADDEQEHEQLVAALRTARRGLQHATPGGTRLRALLWPASLVRVAGSRLVEVRRSLSAVRPFRRVGRAGPA
ncbi:MAG: DUF3488 and transglutaminase-like domain-containing protein [Blastococcus sp.]